MWKAPTIRGCASVSALALNGAPKSMGRKGNGRKRNNKKGQVYKKLSTF